MNMTAVSSLYITASAELRFFVRYLLKWVLQIQITIKASAKYPHDLWQYLTLISASYIFILFNIDVFSAIHLILCICVTGVWSWSFHRGSSDPVSSCNIVIYVRADQSCYFSPFRLCTCTFHFLYRVSRCFLYTFPALKVVALTIFQYVRREHMGFEMSLGCFHDTSRLLR